MGIINNMQEYLTDQNTINPPVQDIIDFIKRAKPEPWNPFWTKSQIDHGIYQFWLGAEFSYERAYFDTFGDHLNRLTNSENKMNIAIESCASVRENPKFAEIFGQFSDAMGLERGYAFAHWKPLVQKIRKLGCDIGIEAETLTQIDYVNETVCQNCTHRNKDAA